MDKSTFEQRVARLREVNGVIASLEPAIQADALALLSDYVTGEPAPLLQSPPASGGPPSGDTTSLDVDALIDKFSSDKPAENGLLVAAVLYATYGKGPFAAKDFNQLADAHSLVMPSQFHKTLGPIKRDDAKIFRKTNEGWQITVQGEVWLRKTFGVTRGSQPMHV